MMERKPPTPSIHTHPFSPRLVRTLLAAHEDITLTLKERIDNLLSISPAFASLPLSSLSPSLPPWSARSSCDGYDNSNGGDCNDENDKKP